MKSLITYLMVIFSVLGIFDAGYITYEKYTGVIPKCIPGFECGKVLNSPWSNIGPIPLSLLGLIFYATVLVLVSMLILEIDVKKLLPFPSFFKKVSTFDLVWAVTLFGFLFSIYLLVIMGVVIQGWCTYCLISASTCSLLFLSSNVLKALGKK